MLPTAFAPILMIAAIFAIIIWSYFAHKNNCVWLSNVLISLSCGLASGFVIYLLSNYRANRGGVLKTEHDSLQKFMDYLLEQKRTLEYYICYNSLDNDKEDMWGFIRRTGFSVDEIENRIVELPEHVFYDLLDYFNNHPLSKGSLKRELEEAYDAVEDELDVQNIVHLCEKALEIYKKYIDWILPVKEKIDISYNKYKKTSI